MWLWDYVILRHPGGDGEGPTELVKRGEVLAQNERNALMLIGREFEDEDLSKITVQLKMFRDNQVDRY